MKYDKRMMHALMTLLVIAWGLDYFFAKKALVFTEPMTLLFFKFLTGFLLLLAVKLQRDRKNWIRKRDIPMFFLCALLGEVLYFYFEYNAMDYLPVSLITIVLAFVPAVSILIERIFFHEVISRNLFFGVLGSVLGVAFVIGLDFRLLLQGRLIGYLLAFGAVFSWNAYNFITASLHEKYDSITLTYYQLLGTLLITAPYAFTHLPKPELVTASYVGGVIYLGLISTGVGFLIMVKAIHVLGVTVTSLYANFLPVTATFFGWLLLGERISLLQLFGGIIVVSASYVVIKKKGQKDFI